MESSILCSCLSPSVGKIADLSVEPEPELSHTRPGWVTRVDSNKEQGRPKSSGRSSRSQSGACFMIRSHKEPTCCPPFRRPKVSGGSIFAAGELRRERVKLFCLISMTAMQALLVRSSARKIPVRLSRDCFPKCDMMCYGRGLRFAHVDNDKHRSMT